MFQIQHVSVSLSVTVVVALFSFITPLCGKVSSSNILILISIALPFERRSNLAVLINNIDDDILMRLCLQLQEVWHGRRQGHSNI